MGCMRDRDLGRDGSEDGKRMTKRIGTADREQAIALLDEHWRAGRLDPGEHELRVTRAKTAVTQGDLDVLFIDLPDTGHAPKPTGAVASVGARGFLENGRETIMALMPFGALALFFTTGQWMWLLTIPVMGILLYGPEGGRKAGRRRARDQKRGRW